MSVDSGDAPDSSYRFVKHPEQNSVGTDKSPKLLKLKISTKLGLQKVRNLSDLQKEDNKCGKKKRSVSNLSYYFTSEDKIIMRRYQTNDNIRISKFDPQEVQEAKIILYEIDEEDQNDYNFE